MKLTPALLALVCLLTACGHKSKPQPLSADARFRQQLIGTWIRSPSKEEPASKFAISFSPDGTFVSKWATGHDDPTSEFSYEATWDVKDGAIVATITKSSSTNSTDIEAVGKVDHYDIIRLNETNLVYKGDGQAVVLHRKD